MLKITRFVEISLITIAAGLAIISVNFIFLSEMPQLFATLNLIAAIIMLGIPLYYKYMDYSRIKKIEGFFPKFLRDVAQNINTGMTLPQAVRTVSKNDYSTLTPYIRDMSSKISMGIPFENILNNLAERSRSSTMKRNVQTIIETHRSGGTIGTVLEAVADSLQEIERIKRERSSSVYAQMLNGYLIFIVFLFVMVGLSSFLLPTFRLEETAPDMGSMFIELFRNLIVIQGLFAGIAIGKMAEGRILAGVKHALVLVTVGYSVFLLLG